ncbi:hypothetical protein AOQ84DRAFT_220652 [Glonium stellatum]|uniref:Uncharacterized protein n=1 Tax=Glonium stellatum TaxID=574774 RepID=A0A8E2F3S3_9PEZI|nr:hypothetical protein AOQ84DRAFT_220652 [Glonium stellatum]
MLVTCFWPEGPLILEPSNLRRLVTGIKELDAPFCEVMATDNPCTNILHVQDWCIGIRDYLDDYGTAFMRFPLLIRTLDLKSFYFGMPPDSVAKSLTLEKIAKESEKVLSESLSASFKPHYGFERYHLGHKQISLFKARLGFFIYDPTQDIFLSGDGPFNAARVFVQHAETGRRLPPIGGNLHGIMASKNTWQSSVITAKVSSDGWFFVIAYSESFTVWVIERNLMSERRCKVSRRLENVEWASRLIICTYDESAGKLTADAAVITLSLNNRLYVPGGWFNLPSREFHSFRRYEPSISLNQDFSMLFRVHEAPTSKRIFQHLTDEAAGPLSLRTLDVDHSIP